MSYQSRLIKAYTKEGYYAIKLAKTNKNGINDLIFGKDGKAIFIESKEKNDTLKPLQKHRIDELISYGFEAGCMQDGQGLIYGNVINVLNIDNVY